jgi:predicted ATPase|tara:strand:+ start:1194 stop:1604 length:411 start_codon:yes stop_codon:yes gene_type:complete
LSDIQLDVELLKKDVKEMKFIHGRLDNAISKISDVSNSINRMLAVHEEKLSSQEEAIINAENLVEARRMEFNKEIKELHDRITKNSKEQIDAINNLKTELSGRVAVLDKFRWVLIGGSIVIGFIIHKLMNIGITIS